MPEPPRPDRADDPAEELMLRRADLRDRLDELTTAHRQLLWTIPIAAAVSTLVMDPAGLTSVLVIFAVTAAILSLFA